jgi:hypothetical protein
VNSLKLLSPAAAVALVSQSLGFRRSRSVSMHVAHTISAAFGQATRACFTSSTSFLHQACFWIE